MRRFFVLSLGLLLACCVTPNPPAPPPPPAPVVVAPPVRPAPQVSNDWRDWPLTPGNWRYRATQGGSTASFGTDPGQMQLMLTCDRAAGRVRLTIHRPATAPLTIRTSSTLRSLTGRGDASGAFADVDLAASDSLLDAMGFSRGRFVIEQTGQPPLVVPAWAEILRVTEDCRG